MNKLMEASWQLCIGAAVVWLLSQRLTGKGRAWLWRAVGVKACMAVFFVLPLAWLAAESVPAAPVALDTARPVLIPEVAQPRRFDMDLVWLGIWAAGLIFGLVLVVVRTYRAERFVRQVAATGTAETVCGCRVIRTAAVSCPLILGVWRSTILLPADSDTSLPLAHELAHADRHDLAWDVFMSVLRAAFWFHPLAWLAAHEHRQACEEASDALAIARTGANPTHYGHALLRYASQPAVSMTALASSATTLRRRIHHMHRRLPHPAIIAAVTLACILSLIPAQLVAAEADPATPHAPSIDERASNLIARPAVKKDIGLSETQMAMIQKAWDANESEIGRIGRTIAKMKEDGVPVKERVDWENREKDALWAKNARDALAVLSEGQRNRLRQIALQATGPMALGEQPIGEQAGLAPAKISEIASIAANAQRASIRLSVQNAHEDMERFRKGQNLSGAQRTRFLFLDEKSRRVWQHPVFKRYDASLKLRPDDPERVAAGKEFRVWIASYPNRLTAAENKEYFELSKLAATDPTRKARDQRYARLHTESLAHYNDQCLRLLTPAERRGWKRLLGRTLSWH